MKRYPLLPILIAGAILLGNGLFWYLDLLPLGPARQGIADATCKALPNCTKAAFAGRHNRRLDVTIRGGSISTARIKQAYKQARGDASARAAFLSLPADQLTFRAF